MPIQLFILAVACAILPIAALGAADQIFFTKLSGANEIPPNPSPGTGQAVVTYSPDTAMMRVQATFSNLGGTTTMAHIHCCVETPGTNVGVATVLPSFTGFPLGVTAGAYENTFDMTQASSYNPAFVTAQGSISAALAALMLGMANGTAYFNIHTSTYAGGEIRGYLMLDSIFTDGFE